MWLRTANKSFVSALALREGCIENIDEARRIVQADTAHLIADRIDVMKNTVRDKLATRDKISVEVLREATLHVRNTGVTEACRHAQRSYIEALIGELGRFLPPVTGPTGATGVQGRNNHG
jgi:alcohol dehydrogenase class IV